MRLRLNRNIAKGRDGRQDADASAGEVSADGAEGAVPKHVDGSAAGREVAGVEERAPRLDRRKRVDRRLMHLNYFGQSSPDLPFMADIDSAYRYQ
jgi:hypothetical protein